jgi:hypothetical protein
MIEGIALGIGAFGVVMSIMVGWAAFCEWRERG